MKNVYILQIQNNQSTNLLSVEYISFRKPLVFEYCFEYFHFVCSHLAHALQLSSRNLHQTVAHVAK